MKGIDFVIDDNGNRRAVLIDLETWGELWEDFYDAIIARERAGEPADDWSAVKERLGADTISE